MIAEQIENVTDISISRQPTLSYLFFTFLKIGSVSFGGYMALVSLIQRVMVEKDETVENELIIDSITIASMLPGPVAVNIVANIGYHLRGKTGAVISMFAILLPACTLMLMLSWAYFSYAYKVEWTGVMHYVIAAVSALILSTGFNMYKKEIGKNFTRAILCLVAVIIMTVTSNYLITIGVILSGGIAGIFIANNNLKQHTGKKHAKWQLNAPYGFIIGLLAVNEVLFLTNIYKTYNSQILKLVTAFSGISLTLFGGGYVMIPMVQSLFVNELHWLTNQQFIDAIAFSQATPGPILVSATFIGYKLAGVWGAVLATGAMFAPSAILMIIVSKVFKRTKENSVVKNMINGIKAVVIGLIIASAIRILGQQPFSISLLAATLVALILNLKYKVSPVYLIIGAIFLGITTKYFI